ncbi:Uncharacterized protein APZ42_007229 [Daphnia magna]|uniref:Uncharacterized protein n=1 Tax=Daphnia magna TaxID=35525 RepID=A0A164FF17_9CRUS|nr:Uncharacterized protein APZ42_007229 [Daphnia magna]
MVFVLSNGPPTWPLNQPLFRKHLKIAVTKIGPKSVDTNVKISGLANEKIPADCFKTLSFPVKCHRYWADINRLKKKCKHFCRFLCTKFKMRRSDLKKRGLLTA